MGVSLSGHWWRAHARRSSLGFSFSEGRGCRPVPGWSCPGPRPAAGGLPPLLRPAFRSAAGRAWRDRPLPRAPLAPPSAWPEDAPAPLGNFCGDPGPEPPPDLGADPGRRADRQRPPPLTEPFLGKPRASKKAGRAGHARWAAPAALSRQLASAAVARASGPPPPLKPRLRRATSRSAGAAAASVGTRAEAKAGGARRGGR